MLLSGSAVVKLPIYVFIALFSDNVALLKNTFVGASFTLRINTWISFVNEVTPDVVVM
jgi:hypothetical protein